MTDIDCPEPEWRLTFQDAESFRSLVEAASSVMPKVVFNVAKEGDDRFLLVDGSDMALTCWLRARLVVDHFSFPKGEAGRDAFSFCVECKHVLIAIDTPSLGSCCVILEGYEGKAKVRIHLSDPDQGISFSEKADLDTYMDGERPQQRLQPLEYNMMLEVDVLRLRELARKARRAHAEFIRFAITLRDDGPQSLSRVTMSYHGDISSWVCFINRTQTNDDGSIIVRAVSDSMEEGGGASELPTSNFFVGSYALDKIEAFLKVVKCRVITTHVQQEQPMLFQVPLGPDNESYVHFLIAPKIDSDF